MSGLVRYLVDFFSPDKQKALADVEGVRVDPETGSNDDVEQKYQYQLSLSSVIASSPTTVVPLRALPNVDGNVAVTSAAADDDDDDEMRAHTDETPGLKYPEYREYSNQVLKDYIYKRYIPGRADSSDCDDHSEDYDDQNQDGGNDHHTDNAASLVPSPGPNQEPESQSGWTTLHNSATPTRTREPTPARLKSQNTKIPLVHDTLHVVHSISQLDMYTKLLHLSLCRVEKVWPLRLSKRAAKDADTMVRLSNHNDSKAEALPASPVLLPLFQFGRYEDDGPLFCAYKYVMTLELTQLDAPHTMQLHQTASNADPQGKLYRRVRVYLYNRYAKLAHDFLQKHDNCSFYCRLVNIPATCIFPYRPRQQGWFDNDVSDHVLCIGDKSQCQTNDENGRMFFEHVDLQLYLLAVPHDRTKPWSQCILDPLHATEQREPKDSSLLVAALQSWNNKRQDLSRPNATQQSILPLSSHPQATSIPQIGVVRDVVDTDQEPTTLVRPVKRIKLQSTETKYTDLAYLQNVLLQHLSLRNSRSPQYPSVNVLGVVIGFSLPTRTKTNQWIVTISLVDPSLPIDDSGEGYHVINVNIFRRKIQDLPTVRRAGDMVRLEDAGIQEYRGEMQLLGRTTTKIHVFSRDQSSSTLSFECDADGAIIVEDEKDYLDSIWDWGQERIATKPTIKRAQRIKLSEVASMEEAGDCTAMVCGLFETQRLSDSPIPRGFLRLWDGTGAPSSDPLPPHILASRATSAATSGDPPTEAMVALHLTIETMNNSPYRTETTLLLGEVVSVCGRVVNLAVWESPHWDFAKRYFKVGDFIRLRNVSKGTLNNGLTCLMAKAKSCLVPLPVNTLEIRHLLVDHQLRMERHDPPNPSSGLLPISLPRTGSVVAVDGPPTEARREPLGVGDAAHGLEGSPVTNALDVLAACESGQGQYLCRFSITAILPECNNEIVRLCNVRNANPSFRFAVNLKDRTDELVAVVVGSVGDALFGMSAFEACQESREEGKRHLSRVCQPGLFWTGVVETRLIDGECYFFLKSAEPVR